MRELVRLIINIKECNLYKLDSLALEFLKECSQNYYDYLKTYDLGFEEIRIAQISVNVFGLQLQLYSKLYSLEGLVLQDEKETFKIDETSQIVAIFYDEKTKILTLGVDDEELKNRLIKNPQNLKLYCDLKFLVENVRNFYRDNPTLSLPHKPSNLSPDFTDSSLHKEQITALNGIFTEPLSYVWGAAGTGKTKVILLNALSFYMKNNLRVAILAPTNNALEQCLDALLERFQTLHLETKQILRLGTPSQKFALKYPINCDPLLSDRFSYKNFLHQSLIIAATFDTFLRRIELRELEFAHFFVDEAGFSPLIKVLPLCAFAKPLTLLGDHKQLKPICVVKQKEEMDWNLATFWRFSSLYLKSFFDNPQDFLVKENPSILPSIPTFKLTHTYRYGDNLAKLLDSHIYQNGLQGQAKETMLFLLDTPCINDTKSTNENHSEAQQCIRLAQMFLQEKGDFAIITPFVNQRRLILQKFPALRNDDYVFTIHSSQGQEFDTIIFSPVHLHYHLSDSRNQDALFSLNVALSRAKEKIILVCDKRYWQGYPQQFLTQLIKIAKPIRV